MTRPRPARAAALLGLIPLLVLGAPAPRASAAACGGTSGVTVVVDFTAFGRGVVTACAAGDPSSGLDALAKAGFSWTGVQQQPGFVCRIDGLPDAQQEACVRTPPADAYWAYFHAEDGEWEYAAQGAGSHDPEPGDTEGWAFGKEAKPSTPPPARPSPTARPVPAATPRPSATSPAPAAGGGPAARPAGRSPTARSGTRVAGPAAAPGPTAAATVGAGARTGPTPTRSADPLGPGAEATPAVPADQPGSSLPTVLGAVVAAALLASAVGAARARRKDGDG